MAGSRWREEEENFERDTKEVEMDVRWRLKLVK